MTRSIYFAILFCALFSLSGCNSHADMSEADKTLTLNLKGTGTMYLSLVPDVDGDGADDQAMCFDVDLLDLKTGKQLGYATDCLYNPAADGDGLNLVGTAFFNFWDGGTLVTRGVTTVHPGQKNSLDRFTHITGAAPSPSGSDILSGTERYLNASGSVRLSGLVDMSNFTPMVEGTHITFDCIFLIKLD